MGFIVFLHVCVAILLVITVLMQAGRGGGLAESFSSAESMFGTQANSFMVKLSTILALIFLVTSLTLAVNSSKRDKSLMSNSKLVSKVAATVPVAKAEEGPTVKVGEPKPMTATANAVQTKESMTPTVTNSAK